MGSTQRLNFLNEQNCCFTDTLLIVLPTTSPNGFVVYKLHNNSRIITNVKDHSGLFARHTGKMIHQYSDALSMYLYFRIKRRQHVLNSGTMVVIIGEWYANHHLCIGGIFAVTGMCREKRQMIN
ncbi:MAG: hypothetical protein Q7W05_10510 [Deltaproteobacteria bacterium]|nr:hypothetical protein [Deltaproteobacteria bacterium]